MKSRYERNEQKRKLERREKKKGVLIKVIIILAILLIFLAIWGKFIEPNILTINDYKIESKDIPDSFNGSKIVQFSDIHYKSSYEKRLKKVVKQINELKPDIVFFTGDLVEEGYELTDYDIKTLVESLSKINSKLGKYAIIGNHDVSNKNYTDIMNDSSFTILKNSYDTVYNEKTEPILVYGLDDTLKGSPKIRDFNNKKLSSIDYKIVLVHEPDYINEFIYDYDVSIVMAGHSHGSQVNIPGINRLGLPKGCKKYYKKYYEVDNVPVYISNGVGSSLIDFRLFSPPSVNVYRLYSK